MSKSRAAPAAGARTLEDLVRDFRSRLGPEGPLEDGYLAWIRQSPRLYTAIDRAVRSRKPNGKMHNHQSRIPLKTLLRYGRRLEMMLTAEKPRDFHHLLMICNKAAIKGIGPVTQYDVAVRIGAFAGLEPTFIYLHAGVKQGADALGIETRGREFLRKGELPEELRRLSPDEAEDFLCVYRDLFPQMTRRAG